MNKHHGIANMINIHFISNKYISCIKRHECINYVSPQATIGT